MVSVPQPIGIVACSAEGAALCYRTICAESEARMGKHNHPEVSMHSYPLAEYIHHITRNDWGAVASLMLSSADKLEKAGARFLICPDNTIHQAMPWVKPQSRLPWLHIAGEVASEAVARGYRKLAITGTRSLTESNVYPEMLSSCGLESLRPNSEERREIDRIIFEELVRGLFTAEATSYFLQVIDRMKREGCDAVVLGCTEIPLIIHEGNSSLPVLDSTRLLARAALRRSLAGGAQNG